jgi:hypothetical protein
MRRLLFLVILLPACLDEEVLIDDDETDTEVETDAQMPSKAVIFGYSPWQTFQTTTGFPSIQFRACKTSTRIYWQFQNNNGFVEVITKGNAGSSMVRMSTNIDGVSSGSKYRTRGDATWFNAQFNGSGHALITGQPISQIPTC